MRKLVFQYGLKIEVLSYDFIVLHTFTCGVIRANLLKLLYLIS